MPLSSFSLLHRHFSPSVVFPPCGASEGTQRKDLRRPEPHDAEAELHAQPRVRRPVPAAVPESRAAPPGRRPRHPPVGAPLPALLPIPQDPADGLLLVGPAPPHQVRLLHGGLRGGSIRKWWDWGWSWIMSRKPVFAQDLEMNEEETKAIGSHNRGSWRHVFYKVRSEIRRLVGSDNNVGLPQTCQYDPVSYAQNFDHGRRSASVVEAY